MANHPIIHVEIPTSNAPESAKFYSTLFGWNMQHEPEMDYWMFDSEPNHGGGFIKVGEPSGQGGPVTKPGDVLVYVYTEDLDASLAQAEQLGGSIEAARTEIPGMGWYGVFRDPTGNRIGLFQGVPQEQGQGQEQPQGEAVTV